MSEVLQKLNVTEMDVIRDNGILSRNVEEAEKIKKTKIKKIKKPKKEVTELEKLDLEFEELKKQELEKVDEAFKYQRKPKEKPEEETDESKPIKIGKGKIPQEKDEQEDISLKKVKPKPEETVEEAKEKPKLKGEETEKPKEPEDTDVVKGPKFEPFDIDREDVDLLDRETISPEIEIKEKAPKDKTKYVRKKKEKPTPEAPELVIEKGVPKQPEEEKDDTVSFKIPRKDKPDEDVQDIKLKPIKKPEKDQEYFTTEVEGPEKPTQRVIEIKPDDDGITTIKIKEKVKKKVVKKKIPEEEGAPSAEKAAEIAAEEEVKPEALEDHETDKAVERKPIAEKEDDVTPKAPRRGIPEPEPEDIKLKPFKKPEKEEETYTVKVEVIEKPTQKVIEIKEDEEETTEIEIKDKTRKKIVKKKRPEKDQLPSKEKKPEDIPSEKEAVASPKDEDYIPKTEETAAQKPVEEVVKKLEAEVEVIPEETKPDEAIGAPESIISEEQKKKLKKPVDKKKKADRPKFLLKSRINYVDFPPLSEAEVKPKVTTLEPVVRDNGVLSRNVEEAAKVKPKRKKPKIPDLEKLDKEYEEAKKDIEKVDDIFKVKPEKKQKVKPIKMEVIRVNVVVHKAKVLEITPEKVNLAEIKLKKPKAPQRQEPEGVKIPKFKLKSRINYVDFPPITEILQKPQVTEIGAVRDNGVISRNIEEAKKLKKKKIKKMDDIDRDLEQLEKLDLEMDEIKKRKPEKVDELFKYERKPKEEPEAPEDVTVSLKIGKGKAPQKPDEEEGEVKLKKRPDRTKEELPEDVAKEKKIQIAPGETKETQDKGKVEGPPFEPFKFEHESPDELELELPDHEEPEADKSKKDKTKYRPKKKEKPEQEFEPITITKGIPKPPTEEEEPEVKFRIPKKDKPEEQPETLTLKPFKKEDDKVELKPELVFLEWQTTKVVIIPRDESDEEEEVRVEKRVKKKVIKKKKDKPEEEKPSEEEKPAAQDLQEKPEEEVATIVLKRKKSVPEAPEEETPEVKLVLEKPKPIQPEEVEEVEAELVLKKEVPVPKSEDVEELTIKIEPEVQEEEEVTIETVTKKKKIKKPKEVKPEQEEVKPVETEAEKPAPQELEEPKLEEFAPAEEPKPEGVKPEDELAEVETPQEVVIKKKRIPKKEEVESEVETKIVLPKKEEEEESKVLVDAVLKLKPEDVPSVQTEPEDTEAQFTIVEKPQDKIPEVPAEEVTEAVVIKKKKKKPVITEEPEAEITLKKDIPKEDETEYKIEEAEVKIKPKRRKPSAEEAAAAEITIKKAPEEEAPVEEVEEKITIKKPKKKVKPEEEGEAEITMKKIVPVTKDESEEETEAIIKPPVEEVEEDVTIKKPKDKVTPEDEGEAEITIKKIVPVTKEESEDEAEAIVKPPVKEVEEKVTIKKPKKKVKPVDEGEAEITIKKIVPVTKEDEEEEDKSVIKPPSEEVEEEVTFKKPKKKTKPTDEAEAEVTVKRIVPISREGSEEKDEMEAEVTIKRKKEEPEDVSAELKTKPEKKPEAKDDSDEITVKRLKPVRRPSEPEQKEETDVVETVTFRPKKTKKKEDVEQEFKISLDSYAEEEITLSTKVKIKPKKQKTFSEETAEESVKIRQEVEDEGPAIEEIIDEGSADEVPAEDDEVSESFHIAFKRRPSRKYSVVEEDEESISFKPLKKTEEVEAETVVTLKPKRKESVVVDQEAASLSIVKEKEEEIEVIHVEEVVKGDVYYCITIYDAEADQAIDLVEGEKVFVMDTSDDSGWWLVKKNLTDETGWVPSKILMTEPQYTEYVLRKLNEKIDKLPVLEKPKSSDKTSAPKFVKKLQPITTPDGYTVKFECKVEGFPRPQVTWFRQTHIIKESKDFQMFYDEENVATLVIKEVFPEDAGTFTCVAKNSSGFASSTTELIVQHPLSSHGSDLTSKSISRKSLSRTTSICDILEGIPPTFTKKPKPQCIPEEEDVVVESILTGSPQPEIKWYRNGKRITTKTNVTITTTSETHTYYKTILKIKKVTKKQEGHYKIVAKNTEGEASVEFTLKVISKDKEPPEVIEPLVSLTVRKGQPVTLSTTIVGNPTPTIEWLKDGKPFSKPTPKKDGNTYSLTIDKARPEDATKYTVKAKNPLGEVETSANLAVEEFPDNEEPPLFTKRFEEQNVPEKSPLVLRAKVTGFPRPEVYWLKNNEPIKSSDRIKMIYEGENIELSIAETNSELDTGDYKCVAINSVGKASHGARVSIEVETVKFTKFLKETYESLEREKLEMECETSHSVRTKWWFNDTEISGMDHRVVIQDGRTHKLVIKNISKKDEGKYKCTVKNQKTETTVKVQERKLEFVKKLQDLEITEKDTAILEVEITSDTADVVWYKDGTVVKEDTEKFETEKIGGTRRLLVRSTSIHDEGEYSCTLLEEECKAEVTVIELPPEIVTPLQDKTVNKGEKAVFDIELSKGDALARWYKDGKEIQFSEHIQLSIDGKKQKLKIYNSEAEDEGIYSCEVGNQSSKAKLTVNVPSCVFLKPLPEYTVVPINTDAEFTVEISKEDAEVTWWCNNKRIEKSTKYSFHEERHERKLIVHKTTYEDEYEYSCTVEKYQLKTSSKLKIGDKPSPPRGPLEVSGMSDTSFTIGWQPSESDGGSPIIEYIVEMKEATSKKGFKKVGATKGDITDLSVNYLEKGHGYKFKITARNEIGVSEPYLPEETIIAGSRMRIQYHFEKNDETFYLLFGVFPPSDIKHKSPPSAPINLKVKDLTNRTASISWEPPLQDGGTELTGYIVEKKLEYMPKWEKVYTLEASTLEYTFENLKEKSDYKFRVFAENVIGVGPPATTDVVQMRLHATVPSPPTGPLEIRTIGPNAIVVEWGIPEWDGGAPLLGYNIAIRDTKKTMWMEIGKTLKGVQKFTIRDLQEDHEYMIRIFARNEIGLSDPLESDEPFKVPSSGETDQEDFIAVTDREPTSYSTETSTSWLRDNSMDADIVSYSKGTLLKKDEYFFRIWCYATKLFKD